MERELLRIAQVVGKVAMAGVDTVVMNYYLWIDRSQFQFDFFMDGCEETRIDKEIEALGGRVFKLPPYEEGMRKNLAAFRKLIREKDYKIVHCHMNTLSLFWLREAKKAGVPIRIAHSHSTAGKGEAKRNLMKYILRPLSKIYANRYCACSHYAGRWLFGNKFYVTGKVNLIRNAIDVDKFAYDENTRAIMRTAFGINRELVIGHAGRFMYQKNHEFLVSVFEHVHKLYPNSVLLLAGTGPRGNEIERLVNEKGLMKSVLFLGERRDVPKIMQAMDVFVFPSRYEGLGLAAIEAQAAGLPCYISDKVPDDAIITDTCKKLSLNDPPEIWAERIVGELAGYKRESNIFQINAQGYNIRKEVKNLESYYRMCSCAQ